MKDNHVDDQDLKSVFTTNLPEILKQFKVSLAVSTYQCGKLIFVRNENNTINTHFRNFNRPMGVAVKPGRISVGCLKTVVIYQNVPAVINRLPNPDVLRGMCRKYSRFRCCGIRHFRKCWKAMMRC